MVSAASVLSPQSAMAAVLSADLGLECEVIIGGTTVEKAMRHPSVAIAAAVGAKIRAVKVGYNPFLQREAARAAEEPGVWRLPYGITTPSDANPEEVRAFLQLGAAQVRNLPDSVTDLVLPCGSGNTAAGVLYGLHDYPGSVRVVHLMGIGPDRVDWMRRRLGLFGRALVPRGIELDYTPLHPYWATYGDRMPETLDGIVLHPTYEGKIARYLDVAAPLWWSARDGTTCFWIVGGPLAQA